uniref:Uncharacterized protein n=1 Tax=Arundo donax TaxID=35708 RepID=A0A0A8YNC5_ARUDO
MYLSCAKLLMECVVQVQVNLIRMMIYARQSFSLQNC